MTHHVLVRIAVACVTAFAMAGALAQTAPSDTALPPARAAPPVSDVGPAPAEDRSSAGAIVLDGAPVRAQRERGTGGPTQRMGNRARTDADKARAAEAERLRKRGAGSLTE